MKQGTNLGSQIGRWIILAAVVALLGALLLTIRPVGAQPAPPGTPTNLTALAVGTARIELSWEAPSDTGGDKIVNYVIEKQVGGVWPDVAAIPDTEDADGPNFTPTGVQTYYDVMTGVTPMNPNTYRVRAENKNGTGAPSNTVTVAPPVLNAQPSPPTLVVAIANGPAEINLTWSAAAAGAAHTGFVIEYSKDGKLPWERAGEVGKDVLEFSHKRLKPATAYYYRVAAKNDQGRGPVGTDATLVEAPDLVDNANDADDAFAKTTPKGVPAVPSGLRLRAVDSGKIEVYWNGVKSDNAPVTGYVVYWSDDGKVWSQKTTSLDLEVGRGRTATTVVKSTHYVTPNDGHGLVPGGTRFYRVAAVNDIGIGLVSGSLSTTTPTTPQPGNDPVDAPDADPPTTDRLRASAQGPTSITLQWGPPGSTGNSPITRYKVEYSKTSDSDADVAGALPWKELATVTTRTYTHTGLTPDTRYHYRVSAENSFGRGPVYDNNGAVDDATTLVPSPTRNPSEPRNLTALAVSISEVELSWQAPSSNGGARIDRYILERTVDINADPIVWISVGDEVARFFEKDSELTDGTQYHYQVKAVSITQNESPPTTAVPVTTIAADALPGQPAAVAATPNGAAEINLTWTESAGNPTGYVIEYSKDGSQPWERAGEVGGNVLEFKHNTGLKPATVYYYRVAAKNGNWRGQVSSVTVLDDEVDTNANNTNEVAKTMSKGVPAEPSGLRLRPVSSTDIEVYWSEVKSDNAPVTGYWVYDSSDGVTWTRKSTGDNNAPVKETHTRLTIDEADDYRYRVAAVNDIGIGLVSDIETAIFPREGSQPVAPANLVASANDSASITLTWSVPINVGDPAITEYKVEYSKNATTPHLPWMELATVTSRTYTPTGLTPNTTYYYRVSAVGMDGRGPVNAPVANATTEYAPPSLASLMVSGPSSLPNYAENGTAVVGEYTALGRDQEKASWSREGPDAGDFTITGGMLKFRDAPNFESPADSDLDNTYKVTVKASAGTDNVGTLDVTITVTDVNEYGTIILDPESPVVDGEVTAILTDPDGGVTGTTWKWARSADEDGTYADIGGATSASYTPVDTDASMYLQATATYSDPEGPGKSAISAVARVSVAGSVLTKFDDNENGMIDRSDVIAAINRYLDDEAGITRANVIEVINRYLDS